MIKSEILSHCLSQMYEIGLEEFSNIFYYVIQNV